MLFPFLAGRARRRGLDCRWLRFAVPPDLRQTLGEDGACLLPADLARLEEELRSFRPARVLFDRPPASALAAAVEAAGARWSALEPGGDPSAAVAFLGLSRGPAAAPDYGWVAGNEAARALEPLPFVLDDVECRYRRPAAGNPFFAGLDLPAARARGCSFCVRPESSARALPLPSLAEQLAAVEAGCPRGAGPRLRIRVVGERVLRRVDELARLPVLRRMRPADLLLDGRVDAITRGAARIERALRRLKGSGHRVSLALVGMESFCSAQLGRYNKGVRAPQNLEAARLLLSWEARFPETFTFREHGGLSVISFDPWARPEELDLNLAVAELAGLLPVLGKLWTSRLRLYPGLPLEARARRDGLLAARPADPRLDAARREFYERELPWRFEAPAMEAVNQLLARFPDAGSSEDPLSRSVAVFLEQSAAAGLPPTAAGHLVVLAAQRAAAEGDVAAEVVLARARELLAARAPAVSGDEAGWVLPSEEARREAEALASVKPVVKVEPIRPDDAEGWRRLGLPNARLRLRTWGAPAYELFCGRSRSKVRRAAELTEVEAGAPPGELLRATRALGTLLGYPRCCAGAHALSPRAMRQRYFWRHAVNRAARAQAVPWELNPAGGAIAHVPCSLSCAESLSQARAALPRLGEERAGRLKNPFLLLWDAGESWVELVPEGEPGERFSYRAGARASGGPDLEAVLLGDELVLGPETTLVLKGGRPLASLSGRAFLWWHRRPFQAEFWTALAGVAAAAEGVAPERAPSVDARGVGRVLASVNAELLERGLPCRGRWEEGLVRLTLAGGTVELFLAPRASYTGPSFDSLPSFAVCLRGEPELGSTRERLLRVYLRLLARRDGELALALRGPAPAP